MMIASSYMPMSSILSRRQSLHFDDATVERLASGDKVFIRAARR